MVFEFVIATLFFLAIVAYVITNMNNSVFMHSREHQMNMLEIKAWQVSEALVTREGVWTGGVPQEIGLAQDWPVLSDDKINDLDNWCGANMDEMLVMLDVDPLLNGVELEISRYTGPGEEMLLDCGNVPGGRPSAEITRFAVKSSDNNMLRVNVRYW